MSSSLRCELELALASLVLVAGLARAQPAPGPAPSRSAVPTSALPSTPAPEPIATRPVARTLTLEDALTYAHAHQPGLRASDLEVRAREAEARVPRAEWLPQVGATAQIFYGSANNTSALSLNVPEVDLPRIGGLAGTGGTSFAPYGSTLVAASLAQELFDFGRIAAQAAAADARTEAARAGGAALALDVDLAVEEAYHGVLAAQDVLHATEEAYRRALTHREYAAAGVRSGLRPPIDLTRADADVAQLGVRRVQAAAGLDTARAELASSMAYEQPLVDAAPLQAGEVGAPAFETAMKRAVEKNPLVAVAAAEVAARAAQAKAIGRELLPNLSLSGGLSGRAGGGGANVPTGEGWLPDVVNWYVGAVLRWNVFDATVLARRAAAVARTDAARANLELVRASVSLAAARDTIALDAAVRTLPGLSQAVDAARANQTQADARFRAGLGTIVELADAENLLTVAELQLAVGRFTVARARAALARDLGATPTPAPAQPGKEP